MSKGEARQLYFPTPPPQTDDVAEVLAWAHREMMTISAVLEAALAREVEFLSVAPAKPREGMIRGADGVNWNPGAGGKGVYAYYSGTWNRLG